MIETLFLELESKKNEKEVADAFSKSGMANKFRELGYGFFPLGYGLLSDTFDAENTKLNECNVMVLGNDFGTLKYLTDKCKGNRESPTNSTINNLKKLALDEKTSFFTNFHLGVRKEGINTKRAESLKFDYQRFCFDFFKKQIEVTDAKIVLCLGHDVREALSQQTDLFPDWKGKSVTMKKLYDQGKHVVNIQDSELGNRKFIVIPHPCDTRNFTPEYVDKIIKAMEN